jgi:hypothetical protein
VPETNISDYFALLVSFPLVVKLNNLVKWWRVFETYRLYKRELDLFGTAYRSNKET